MSRVQSEAPASPLSARPAAEVVLLEWTVHHLREHPYRAVVALASLLLVASLGWFLFDSWMVAAAGFFMLLSASAEFLFPIRHRLTERGALVTYGAARLEIEWLAVKRILVGERGIKLSPLASPGRLDPFRGVLLRFDESNGIGKERLLAIARERRPEAFS
jgi:hypothetical protein